jgi:hypothetical protein
MTTTVSEPDSHEPTVLPIPSPWPDWPITLEQTTGKRLLLLGYTVDALIMRAGLGGEVNHQLVRAMLHAPVVVVSERRHAAPDSWIFLTRQRTPMRERTVIDLACAQVGWPKYGSTIPLPPPGCVRGDLRWLEDGTGDWQLPPWSAVVAAVRRTFSQSW